MAAGYTRLPNPPPRGSPWELVERARERLNWSASKLSVEAVGEKSRSHYTLISKRESWETTDLSTLSQFVAALIRAGIPREELDGPGSGTSQRANVSVGDPRVVLPQATREIATMLLTGKKVWPSRAYAAVDAAALYEFTIGTEGPLKPDRLARLAAGLIAVDDPPAGDRVSLLDDGPTGSATYHTVRRRKPKAGE